MNFNEYQKKARSTAKYLNLDKNCDPLAMSYLALGLNGEAGEVAEKFKKWLRDKKMKIDDDFKESVILEIGDCFWYASNICSEMGIEFEEVFKKNIEKLESRRQRNKIHGDGDKR